MAWDAWFTLAVVVVGIGALMRDLLAPDLIFVGMLAVLLASGIVSPQEAFVGFSNPEILAIGALFVVAGALQHTGALGFVATRLFGQITSHRRALLRMMLPTAGISAFLNNTPIVAMFTPVVFDWARRHQVSPSRFLIPLSYATILGGACTLIGTSTNMVVNGLMVGAGQPGMSFFELSAVGVPCAVVGVGFVVLAGRVLLPDRKELLESLGETRREYLVELEVTAECPLVGQQIEEAGLRHLPGLFLVRIERSEGTVSPVGPQERIRVADRLVFTGVVATIVDLQKIRGLVPAGDHRDGVERVGEGNNLSEAVISEDSPLNGVTIRDANFRTRYGAAVVAVHRGGRRLSGKIGDILLRAGDTLLLEASAGFARTYRNSADFYLVSEVDNSAPPRYDKAIPALLALVALITTVTLGLLPMMTAALLAAFAVIVCGCLSVGETRRLCRCVGVDSHCLGVRDRPGAGQDRGGRIAGLVSGRGRRRAGAGGRAGPGVSGHPGLHRMYLSRPGRSPDVSHCGRDRRAVWGRCAAVCDHDCDCRLGRVRLAAQLSDPPDGVRTGRLPLYRFSEDRHSA